MITEIELTTVEILDGAIRAIEERGHAQGAYQEDDGRVCLKGALRIGAGANAMTTYPDQLNFHQAQTHVLSLIYGYCTIPGWNDEEGRTADEVLHLLKAAREAAALEAERAA
jgi:hypothetical protein